MINPEDEILLREAELERTPPELARWTRVQLHRFGATDSGKSAIRLRKGAAKQFIEEVYPLSLWATRIYREREDVGCRSVLGNQRYDAIVTDRSKSPPQEMRLEITLGSSDYAEHLRMVYMEKHGAVPMIGEVTANGTKTNRKIEVTFEWKAHGALVGKAYRQMQDAIERKTKKHYARGTLLLVMIEDVYFELDSDFSDLDTELGRLVELTNPPFTSIFVLGWHGRVAVAATSPTSAVPRWVVVRY
jgi:hypothetical protein